MVTATRETARNQKPEPKPTAAPERASRKYKKKAAASVKTAAATPTKPTSLVPTQSRTPHSRKSQISSITFPSMHVWSLLIGSSPPSHPSPQGQLALALS